MHNIEDIAIIVLAAGNASRMGYAKQLLQYQGKSLIRNAVETAQKVTGSKCFVVLGAYLEEIKDDLGGISCEIVVHRDWKRGMGSSIKAGLKAVQAKYPEIGGILFMVADQPFVGDKLLLDMLEQQISSGKSIVACNYQQEFGTPVLFMQPFFEQLLGIADETGAKKLLQQNPQHVTLIDFELGSIDVDTPDDYNSLNKL